MPNELLLASYIDHTLLKPEARLEQIQCLCAEAKQFHFFSVCVNSSYVKTCADLLAGSGVKVCSVIGFPLGAMDPLSKIFETKQAIQQGAQEIDMVIHIGALKDQRTQIVLEDIKGVVQAAQGHVVKVIIETALLTEAEKKLACELSLQAGAHFVKTSTGFNGGGASVEDVALMKKAVAGKLKVKASGGIKDKSQALALIAAGAERLGTSSGVALVQGQTTKGDY